jgi:hypothetical protein
LSGGSASFEQFKGITSVGGTLVGGSSSIVSGFLLSTVVSGSVVSGSGDIRANSLLILNGSGGLLSGGSSTFEFGKMLFLDGGAIVGGKAIGLLHYPITIDTAGFPEIKIYSIESATFFKIVDDTRYPWQITNILFKNKLINTEQGILYASVYSSPKIQPGLKLTSVGFIIGSILHKLPTIKDVSISDNKNSSQAIKVEEAIVQKKKPGRPKKQVVAIEVKEDIRPAVTEQVVEVAVKKTKKTTKKQTVFGVGFK